MSLSFFDSAGGLRCVLSPLAAVPTASSIVITIPGDRRTRSPCCAPATTGHAATLISPAMNSRRRISISRAGGFMGTERGEAPAEGDLVLLTGGQLGLRRIRAQHGQASDR